MDRHHERWMRKHSDANLWAWLIEWCLLLGSVVMLYGWLTW